MRTILILDDNPRNNERYIDELKKEYEVTVTFKMISALRLLKKKNWDVVVIDVMMPTQILTSDNEMKAGFVFYDQEIKKLNLKSKIIFWSRLADSCFDTSKYPASAGFCFVRKSEQSDHLKKEIDKLFVK